MQGRIGQAGSSSLSAASREAGLHRLATERYDVVVVGGGITGAGVALDAASRGLRTALVERVDLAAGTSRWSSKLIHGGLRYLVRGELGIAWESARERHLLMTLIAPHLVRAVRNLLLIPDLEPRGLSAIGEATVRAGDVLRIASGTPRRLLAAPTRIDPDQAAAVAPGLRRDGLKGAICYWDGQLEDDARLVTAVARTAAAFGADIVTRCAAETLHDDHVDLRDEITGATLTARGHVVNAMGVWAAGHEPSLTITPSLGSHLVVRAEALGHPQAVVSVPLPGQFGRYVLAIPQSDGLVLLGLTDFPAPGADGYAPPVPHEDEVFILDAVNRVLARPVLSSDIVGRFAGLRPLVSNAAGATSDMSRRHLLLDEPGRPVTIVGGKLTTYRRMAQDAVDAVCRRSRISLAPRTRTLALVGAAPPAVLERVRAPVRLVRRYGTEAVTVLELADRHPDLARPVSSQCPTTGAELLFGVLHEGALDVTDLIERRCRISFDDSAIPAARDLAQRVLERAAGA